MKIVKYSVLVLALSAMVAGSALAQSAEPSNDGTVRGRGNMQQGGAASGELNAQPPAGKTVAKGTVGSGGGSMGRGTAGATGSAAPHAAPNGLDAAGDNAAGIKRH